MAFDDTSLGLDLGRLKIESGILVKKEIAENPFFTSLQKRNKSLSSIKCSCMIQKHKNNKKKPHNILREPLLRLSQPCKNINETIEANISQSSLFSQNINPDIMYLHSLVKTCNQLCISSEKKNINMMKDKKSYLRVLKSKEPKDHTKWWKSRRSKLVNDGSNLYKSNTVDTKVETDSTTSSTCSQQALNPPPPCDVTIDELASYFETFVHIPKKMSTMAEMMYI